MEKRNIFNRERRRNWLDLKSGVLANTVGWNSKRKAGMSFQEVEQQSHITWAPELRKCFRSEQNYSSVRPSVEEKTTVS
jgi:hypothetical protein